MSGEDGSAEWTTVVSKKHKKGQSMTPRDTAPSSAASSQITNDPTSRPPRTMDQSMVSHRRDQNISESANSGASSTTSPVPLSSPPPPPADDKAEGDETTSPVVVYRWVQKSARQLPPSTVEEPLIAVDTTTAGPSSKISAAIPYEPVSSTSHKLASSFGSASAGFSITRPPRRMR